MKSTAQAMKEFDKKFPSMILRGLNSIELLTAKTGVPFVKKTFKCKWEPGRVWESAYSWVHSNEDPAGATDQIRSAFVYKHDKFKDTYNVLIVFLTLAVNNNGKYITKVERKKYRVNLNSKAICVAWGNQRAFPLDYGFNKIDIHDLKTQLFEITSESAVLFKQVVNT